MGKKRTLLKGYTCKYCHRYHPFSAWCYAHWDGFNHICDCGARTGIENGEVCFTDPPSKPRPRREEG